MPTKLTIERLIKKSFRSGATCWGSTRSVMNLLPDEKRRRYICTTRCASYTGVRAMRWQAFGLLPACAAASAGDCGACAPAWAGRAPCGAPAGLCGAWPGRACAAPFAPWARAAAAAGCAAGLRGAPCAGARCGTADELPDICSFRMYKTNTRATH